VASGKYFMGTINNESRELNYDRIEKYDWKDNFASLSVRVSSACASPSGDIYRSHWRRPRCRGGVLLHRRPGAQSGMRRETGDEAIAMKNLEQLRTDRKTGRECLGTRDSLKMPDRRERLELVERRLSPINL